jgi:hypothetical protein
MDGGARITHKSETAAYDHVRGLAVLRAITGRIEGFTGLVNVYVAEDGHWALYETVNLDDLKSA